MAKSTDALTLLEKHAAEIRKELAVPRQNEVFRAALEAGFLAAMGDGEMDDTERGTIIRCVELLSQGAVIEWETDHLLDDCADRVEKEGKDKRAKAVGAALKELGHAEAGLLFAAVIARVTNGVDKTEAAVLKAVGGAAGITADKIKAIVKKAALA